MANAITAFTPEFWAPKIQDNLHKSLVALDIADSELRSSLSEGDTVHKPYFSSLSATTYVKGVDVTIQDLTATDETLVVDTTQEASFYVDNVDKIQNKYSAAQNGIDEASYALKDSIDTAVLAEVLNANDTLDDGDIGGIATNAITLTTTNVIEVFSTGRAKLLGVNVVENGDFVAVVSPAIASIIEQKATSTGFNISDAAFKNGYAGDFMGFKIYVSNNLDGTSTRTHCYLGKNKQIDFVAQKMPEVLITQPEKKIGKNIITWDLYGKKTFEKASQRFLDLQIL